MPVSCAVRAAVWFAFSVVCGYIMFRATRRPLEKSVPKMVYRWFSAVYSVCYATAVMGYILLIVDIFGFSFITGIPVRGGAH